MDLNCTAVSRIVTDITDDGQLDPPWIAPIVLSVTGAALCFGGRYCYRSIVMVAGSVAIAVFTYAALVHLVSHCIARISLALAAGAFGGVTLFCLTRVAAAVLSGTAFAGATHLVYDALPVASSTPILLDRDLPYWIAISIAGVLGILLGCIQARRIIVLLTSFGGGIVVAIGIALGVDDDNAWLWLCVAIALGFAGLAVQTRAWRRLARCRPRERAIDEPSSS